MLGAMAGAVLAVMLDAGPGFAGTAHDAAWRDHP